MWDDNREEAFVQLIPIKFEVKIEQVFQKNNRATIKMLSIKSLEKYPRSQHLAGYEHSQCGLKSFVSKENPE